MPRCNLDVVLKQAAKHEQMRKVKPFVLSYIELPSQRLKFFSALAEEFKVSFRVFAEADHYDFRGVSHYHYAEVWMSIGKKMPVSEVYSITYHEIAHTLCYRARRYTSYHEDNNYKSALKAERYVDALAREMFNRRHPGKVFVPSYTTPYEIKGLYDLAEDAQAKKIEKEELRKNPRKMAVDNKHLLFI